VWRISRRDPVQWQSGTWMLILLPTLSPGI
jgi:hypothetical protein